jgi:hypothetical protein
MPTNDILPQIILNDGHNKDLTPYLMFKYAIKTEITRRVIAYHDIFPI